MKRFGTPKNRFRDMFVTKWPGTSPIPNHSMKRFLIEIFAEAKLTQAVTSLVCSLALINYVSVGVFPLVTGQKLVFRFLKKSETIVETNLRVQITSA